MSLDNYEWPETETNVGRCEGCDTVRPLKDGLCKGCARDIHAEAEWDDSLELFTDEDFKAKAMEGVTE